MSKLGKIVADAVTERIRRYRLEYENWAEGQTGDHPSPSFTDVLKDVRRMIEDGFEITEPTVDLALPPMVSKPEPAPEPVALVPEKKRKRPEPITARPWEAYSAAFLEKYKTPPVRNLTVNSQLASFVKRVGEDLAPEVISFYVRHPGQFYSQAMHPISLALRDAEKLAAEYRSRRLITTAGARKSDMTAANADLAAQIMREE